MLEATLEAEDLGHLILDESSGGEGLEHEIWPGNDGWLRVAVKRDGRWVVYRETFDGFYDRTGTQSY